MKFFEDTRGSWYPVSHITRMVEAQKEGDKISLPKVYLNDSEYPVAVYDYTFAELTRGNATTVPAPAGYQVLGRWGGPNGEEAWTDRLDVIAFQVASDGAIKPITCDESYNNDGFQNWRVGLLLPNGRVQDYRSGDGSWESEAIWTAAADEEMIKGQPTPQEAEGG